MKAPIFRIVPKLLWHLVVSSVFFGIFLIIFFKQYSDKAFFDARFVEYLEIFFQALLSAFGSYFVFVTTVKKDEANYRMQELNSRVENASEALNMLKAEGERLFKEAKEKEKKTAIELSNFLHLHEVFSNRLLSLLKLLLRVGDESDYSKDLKYLSNELKSTVTDSNSLYSHHNHLAFKLAHDKVETQFTEIKTSNFKLKLDV